MAEKYNDLKESGLQIVVNKLIPAAELKKSISPSLLIAAYAEESFHDLRASDKEIDELQYDIIVSVYVIKKGKLQ